MSNYNNHKLKKLLQTPPPWDESNINYENDVTELLKKRYKDLDFLVEQAQELKMGYEQDDPV